jgi:hypothetical protein
MEWSGLVELICPLMMVGNIKTPLLLLLAALGAFLHLY